MKPFTTLLVAASALTVVVYPPSVAATWQVREQPTANAERPTPQETLRPDQYRLKTIVGERIVAEFVATCLVPERNLGKTRRAVAASDFDYEEKRDPQFGNVYRWQSSNALLELALQSSHGVQGWGLPRCTLTAGSTTPQTAAQWISTLQPAVEAALQHPVRANLGKEFSLEWPSDVAGLVDRVVVGGKPGARQAVRITLDRWSPTVRAQFEEKVIKGTGPSTL